MMKSQNYWIVTVLRYLLILLNGSVLLATSQRTVKSLPGFNGALPFKLETGYVGVGENDELQLFYYFIESENDPQRDPLVLWLTGGPGCSAFSGLVYEIGPLTFDYEAFHGNLPSFVINKYSWTKVANIIFLDYPAGTGFSYATRDENYTTNDTKTTLVNYIFLRKWLLNHPNFSSNPLYIAGDSYGGKIVPMLAFEIDKANEAALEPRLNLQGYIVGNGVTNGAEDYNERLPFAHRMALVSDEYFELAKKSCNGEYINPDPDNIQCKYALDLCSECTRLIDDAHVLEPTCKLISPKHDNSLLNGDALSFFADYESDHLLAMYRDEDDSSWCRSNNYLLSYIWADDETVREALHIRKGTKGSWIRCNRTIPYEGNVKSVFEHHRRLLSKKGYRALVYSGDHDMLVPYMSTLKWIRALNISLVDDWRAWTVNGQVAGYTMKYKNNEATLTFATVKGAGHTAPEYKPEQCFAMFSRWLSSHPL